MESMLPIGAAFNLNVLAEGKDRAVMKQLLKPFKPGEDRFAGMEVQQAEATGAVIIPDAGGLWHDGGQWGSGRHTPCAVTDLHALPTCLLLLLLCLTGG